MIRMHHDHTGQPCPSQHAGQFPGHARWQHDRQPGVDAQPAHMANRFDAQHQVAEPLVVEEERIASRQDHFVNRFVCGDGGERRVDAGAACTALRVGELAPKTVAAVHGATGSGEEQRPAPVLVHEPGRRERRQLVERVGGESVDHAVFGSRRQHLKQERILRIAGLHAGDEPTGHEQRKPGRSCRQVGGRQPEQTAQFIEIAHRGGEFALPRCGALVADHWQARLRHE